MAKVTIEKREDFEKAFNEFKMQCKREGIVRRCRERQFYTKPSERKRKKNSGNKRR